MHALAFIIAAAINLNNIIVMTNSCCHFIDKFTSLSVFFFFLKKYYKFKVVVLLFSYLFDDSYGCFYNCFREDFLCYQINKLYCVSLSGKMYFECKILNFPKFIGHL